MNLNARVAGRAGADLRLRLFLDRGYNHAFASCPCGIQYQKGKAAITGDQTKRTVRMHVQAI